MGAGCVGDGELGRYALITKSEIACWVQSMERKYTAKQGQYLAFIYYYTKLNGCPPAEADMQRYFKTTPPTVHSMVLNLEKLGLTLASTRTSPHYSRSATKRRTTIIGLKG
ncbi:MAG: hypothetical protein KI793_31675 [Rivularia sp. (in: Bacteria)]|nr:hypothetical protein [Rivularia sp. MS3]